MKTFIVLSSYSNSTKELGQVRLAVDSIEAYSPFANKNGCASQITVTDGVVDAVETIEEIDALMEKAGVKIIRKDS